MTAEVYLDAAASAPLRPQAREAMLAALALPPGNASSPHAAGRRLRKVLGDARESVAALVGAQAEEVVFTSGATESNALAILGALACGPGAIVTTRAEHPSVARVADRAQSQGREVRRAGVDGFGRYAAAEVAALAPGARIVSAVLAQSVTGALEPAAEVGRLLAGGTAAFHVDAAQAAGKVPVDVRDLRASLVSVSAHKMGGPQGVAALIVREGASWRPPWSDGSQERGRRPGTEAPILVAGFGAAAAAAAAQLAAEAHAAAEALAPLAEFVRSTDGGELLTPPSCALPGTLLLAFRGCPGDSLLAALDARGFCVSTGSACASGARTPPEVLLAAGRNAQDAARAIRVSVSWASSPREIFALIEALAVLVPHVRRAGTTS